MTLINWLVVIAECEADFTATLVIVLPVYQRLCFCFDALFGFRLKKNIYNYISDKALSHLV